jgi:hypothetical protein
MPPATSPDELIGNWSVRLTTRVTTCKPMTSPAERSDETWTIDHVSQTLTIMTSSRLELTGPSSSGQRSYFQHTLNAKAKPHATILQFSHSIRDRFWGTLVRAEVIDKRSSDGTCVTVYDVSGTKVAP